MRKLFTLVLFALFAVPMTAQSDDRLRDTAFTLEFVVGKKDVSFNSTAFQYDETKVGYGFRAGMEQFFGREGGRGDIGFGIKGGAAYSGVDAATVDSGNVVYGRGQGELIYQRNAPGKKFRPGVKVTAGFGRERFKVQANQVGNTIQISRGANFWTGGAGAFVDIGEGRKRVRFGAEYFYSKYRNEKNIFGDDRGPKHNFELSFGIVL